MADRIQARAVRRAGELLRQIKSKGNNQHSTGTDITQAKVAADAGMSKRQKDTAVRVANVPEHEIEAAVENPTPARLAVDALLADSSTVDKRRPEIESFFEHFRCWAHFPAV